jgi:hypothetical protein
MAQPAVRVLKILLDWAERGSALVVASLAGSPCCEGFKSSRISRTRNSRFIMRSPRGGQKSVSGKRAAVECRASPGFLEGRLGIVRVGHNPSRMGGGAVLEL